ncbi:MAG TPA: acylphosphatase [Cyclobacteriaceae bacterium]|nr:acylphosphatase [Cyclobacteriaceae bacterium]
MKSYKLIIKGKVQGVFFRATAFELATQLGLKGFAMNLPSGDVHIEAEGDEVSLEEFINWCHQGPEHARVEEVIKEEQALQQYKSFAVRYYYD